MSDGRKLRRDVVKSILSQLRSLRATVARLDSFRFYSSSLLIVYEGLTPRQSKFHPGRKRKKHHHHVKSPGEKGKAGGGGGGGQVGGGADVIFSMNYVLSLSLQTSSSTSTSSRPSSPGGRGKRMVSECSDEEAVSDDDDDEEEQEEEVEGVEEKVDESVEARVTMIDFAHSTFEGFMSDPVPHSGPDSGYLKGLDTLVDIFETALVKTSAAPAAAAGAAAAAAAPAAAAAVS